MFGHIRKSSNTQKFHKQEADNSGVKPAHIREIFKVKMFIGKTSEKTTLHNIVGNNLDLRSNLMEEQIAVCSLFLGE